MPAAASNTEAAVSNMTEVKTLSASVTGSLIASFADQYIRGLYRGAIAACGRLDRVDTNKQVLLKQTIESVVESGSDKTTDLEVPSRADDGTQKQVPDEEQEPSSANDKTRSLDRSFTVGGSVDLDALLDRVNDLVAGGDEKARDSNLEDVALGATPGASDRQERRFAQRLLEQDFPFEKAAAFARAAAAHEEAFGRAPKWFDGQDSNQFALRPLPMPESMALPEDKSSVDKAKHSGRSLWKKLRAKTDKKIEPESGLHLQLFSTRVPADELSSTQQTEAAIVTIDLLEVSPLISKYDAGSMCCKLRTIDSRNSQEATAASVPAVALSAFGPVLAVKKNETMLVIEDVDSRSLELRVCTSESEDAAELCRLWMPVANLVSSSVEGNVVDVWLPTLSPPPQLDVSIKAERRPRDDRSSDVDALDFKVVIHSASNITIGDQITDVYATAHLVAAGSTVVDDVLCTTVTAKKTTNPQYEEKFTIQQEIFDTILAKRREGTKLSLRFVIHSSNIMSTQPDVPIAEFEWVDVYSLSPGHTSRRRLEPRASESEFQRVVDSIARSQRVWRQQVLNRIDAMSAFRAIDTDGNGILDSDELARVAYVMNGGALMTPKEVKAAEAEIGAGTSVMRCTCVSSSSCTYECSTDCQCIAEMRVDGAKGLMHHNYRGRGQDLHGVDFEQFFAWVSKRP